MKKIISILVVLGLNLFSTLNAQLHFSYLVKKDEIIFRWVPENYVHARQYIRAGFLLEFIHTESQKRIYTESVLPDLSAFQISNDSLRENEFLFLKKFIDEPELKDLQKEKNLAGLVLLLCDADSVLFRAVALGIKMKMPEDMNTFQIRLTSLYSGEQAFIEKVNPHELPENKLPDFSATCLRKTTRIEFANEGYPYWDLHYSLDSLHWENLFQRPLVSLNQQKHHWISDTAQLYGRRFYRLKGRTSFGTQSEGELIKSCVCYENDTLYPEIKSWKLEGDRLNLEFNQQTLPLWVQKSIWLKRKSSDFTAEMISGFPTLSPNEHSAYFTWCWIRESGDTLFSNSVYVFRSDDGPPPMIEDLNGEIQQDSLIHLWWNKPMASDLYGYRIFIRYSQKEEWQELSRDIITDTFYNFSPYKNQLARNYYFSVSAVDVNRNASCPSYELFLPFRSSQAPIKPIWKRKTEKNDSLFLEFALDGSARNYLLLIKEAGPKILDVYSESLSLPQSLFTGKSSSRLVLMSKNNSGRKSVSDTLFVAPARPAVFPVFIHVQKRAGSTLVSIESGDQNARELVLYKRRAAEPNWQICKIVKTSKIDFIDRDLHPGEKYVYRVKVIHSDGAVQWSAEVEDYK